MYAYVALFTYIICRAIDSSDFSRILRGLTDEDPKAQREDRLRPHSKWVAMEVL